MTDAIRILFGEPHPDRTGVDHLAMDRPGTFSTCVTHQ